MQERTYRACSSRSGIRASTNFRKAEEGGLPITGDLSTTGFAESEGGDQQEIERDVADAKRIEKEEQKLANAEGDGREEAKSRSKKS